MQTPLVYMRLQMLELNQRLDRYLYFLIHFLRLLLALSFITSGILEP